MNSLTCSLYRVYYFVKWFGQLHYFMAQARTIILVYKDRVRSFAEFKCIRALKLDIFR